MLWSVAALGLAVAMAPLYVSASHSLSKLTGRGAHRVIATQRGLAELDRLRGGAVAEREFAVPELPDGQGAVAVQPAGAALRRVRLTITWTESGTPARAEWTTLVGR